MQVKFNSITRIPQSTRDEQLNYVYDNMEVLKNKFVKAIHGYVEAQLLSSYLSHFKWPKIKDMIRINKAKVVF